MGVVFQLICGIHPLLATGMQDEASLLVAGDSVLAEEIPVFHLAHEIRIVLGPANYGNFLQSSGTA